MLKETSSTNWQLFVSRNNRHISVRSDKHPTNLAQFFRQKKEKGKIKVDEFGQTMSKAPLKIMFIIGFAPSSASPSSHLGENELFFASFSMKAFIKV